MFDISTQTEVERDVPCGSCYHCRITKVNEWTTRMRLQSATYKHTYFVTLTIADTAPLEVLHAHNACLSAVNTFGKRQLTPLTLDKTTVQKFIKRLRRYNNLPSLTYFLVGEYGHKFGRPHYHIIFWCDEQITKEMLQGAWQLQGIPFGEIDFNDLNENGTLLSSKASYSFKYVCKYLQKSDFAFENLPTYKLHLLNDYELSNKYVTLKNKKTNETFMQQIWYDYDQNSETWFDYSVLDELPPYIVHCLSNTYIKAYKPFMLCSKSPAIGSRYFEANKERFQRGDFRLFGILDKDIIYPTYFVRRTKQIICPYVPLVETEKQGVCPASSSCHIPNVETFCNELQGTFEYPKMQLQNNYEDFRSSLRCLWLYNSNVDGKTIAHDLRSLSIYDKNTHTYLVYNIWHFDRYKYDRKIKSYVKIEEIPPCEIFDKLDKSFKDLLKFVSPFDFKRLLNQEELDVYIKSEFGGNCQKFEEYRISLCKQFELQRRDRQFKYYNTKTRF